MAAGLGFKTFTTGEVLTAADTNGYLMQGVLVFASAAARDAAITSPQEGQCCYLKDTDAVLTYSGAAWVGFDDSNAIQNSIVDAKGDLVAASGADTPARLAVGANGETLVADSSTSTGLRYQSGYNGNGIINGGFDIWQRGTSIANTATYLYSADRWQQGGSAAQTTSRQTSSLTGIQYCARVQRNSASTSTTVVAINVSMESADSYRFAGQTVTFSFYARAGANYSSASNVLSVYVQSGTGTDQNANSGYTGAAAIFGASSTLTTSWQRFTYTAAVASSATEIAASFYYTPVGTAGANDYFEVTGVQLELGSVATNFKRAGGTIQGELAACQRYYYRIGGDAVYQGITMGRGSAATTIQGYINTPVTLRTGASSVDYSTLIASVNASGVTAVSSITINQTGKNMVDLTITCSGASFTTGGLAYVQTNNSTSGYLALSAEL